MNTAKANTAKANTAKATAESLLSHLPDDCSYEDIHYHLYVIAKVRRGLDMADQQGTLSQQDVEKRLEKWLIE